MATMIVTVRVLDPVACAAALRKEAAAIADLVARVGGNRG